MKRNTGESALQAYQRDLFSLYHFIDTFGGIFSDDFESVLADGIEHGRLSIDIDIIQAQPMS